MRTILGGKLFVLCLMAFFVSCGQIGDPISDNPIFSNATVEYDAQENAVQFTVNLADTLEFPVGLILPIKDYGELEIVPSDYDQPAQVILTAYLDITGIAGTLVTKLPNGGRLPKIINGPLLQVKIKNNYYIYVSPDTFEYIGFAVLIPSVDDDFPASFSVGTSFKNSNGEVIGSAVFFGPKADGSVSGGIFAVADLSLLKEQISSKTKGLATSNTATNDFSITKKQLKSLNSGGFLKK